MEAGQGKYVCRTAFSECGDYVSVHPALVTGEKGAQDWSGVLLFEREVIDKIAE